MRILVSVDMEGIAGVSGREEITRGHSDYERFRHLMTEEANAAVQGALEAGATSIVVNDSHGGMRNLLYEELDPRAELISGHNKMLTMVEGCQEADAAVFIGYHAMAGTESAAFDHTISGATTHNWWLNGQKVGESQINAALLGHFDVPVALVCGDDKLQQEVKATIPGAHTVVVKNALDHRAVHSKSLAQVRQEIRDGVRKALSQREALRPIKMSGPVSFRIEFTRTFYAESAALWPTVKRIDGRTIEVGADDVVTAWRMALASLRLASTGDN